MRWILALAMIAMIPVLSRFLAEDRKWMGYSAYLLGYLPFGLLQLPLTVTPVSWAGWPGYVKGAGITLLDVLAIAIIMASGRAKFKLPLKWPFAIYFISTLFSLFTSFMIDASLLYNVQLIQIGIIYWAVAVIVFNHPHALRNIVIGLVVGLAIQTAHAFQMSLHGQARTGGFMGANQLGFMIYMVLLPMTGLALANISTKWSLAAIGMCAMAIVLTVSRAPTGLALVGIVLVFTGSALRCWTPHKAKITAITMLALLAASPFAVQKLTERINALNSIETDYDEREAFIAATKMVIKDHPNGIGGNTFPLVANAEGYWERANVSWASGARFQSPHQAYYLHWAEFGLVGLVGVVIFLAASIYLCLSIAFRYRRDPRGDVILGVGVALVMMALHSLYEYMLFPATTQRFIAIGLGITAGLGAQMARKPKSGKKKAPAPTIRQSVTIMR